MKIFSCNESENNVCKILQIVALLLVLSAISRAQSTEGCPDLIKNNKCSCYTLEDGLFLDCQDTTANDVKNALRSLSQVHSLSVYDIDNNDMYLGPHFIPHGMCIKHIHIARTGIILIEDDLLMPLKKCLETLSIVSSKIKKITQKAFSGLLKLSSIDLTFNVIESIPNYIFYGLPLIKLNMKGNAIRYISETAFSTLEMSLSELDLSENNLTVFPIDSLAKLRHLRSLKLSWNEISSFPIVHKSDLLSLENIDLNSNNFEFISEDCLKFCPSLKTLTFHFNFINSIHYHAFFSLTQLRSINLSNNRIKILSPNLFQNNKLLESINLSHNHLHQIHGLFSHMSSLTEVFLNHNNILDVPIDSFVNSFNINTIRLDKNCIQSINSETFSALGNLSKLHLEFNFLNEVPQEIFKNNVNLRVLRIDNNNNTNIKNGTLDNLQKLIESRFSYNRLSSVTKYFFKRTLLLEEIYLDNNKITFIEIGTFRHLNNLRYLDLSSNRLSDLGNILPIKSQLLIFNVDYNMLNILSIDLIRSQEVLEYLSIKNNKVIYLKINSLDSATQLVRLILSQNKISVIEDFAFKNQNLTRVLNLKDNILQNITLNTFFGLSSLEELDLSHNKILYVFDSAFETMKKLRSLNLSNNPIKHLFKNIFQNRLPLSSLSLENCQIESIESGTFDGLNNLKVLSLYNNSVKSNDLISINISSLKILIISFNILDQLPVESFFQLPLLEVLIMEHCNIEHVIEGTFNYNKRLRKINLAQNLISTINNAFVEDDNSLNEYNMSNNFLDHVPYKLIYNLTDIETLDISDNLLSRIELSDFERQVKLKHLILKKNEIKLIKATKQFHIYELVSLDISHNKLDNFPLVIFETFPNLRKINVSHNEILYFEFLVFKKRIGMAMLLMDLSRNLVSYWALPNAVENETLVANIYELHIDNTNVSIVDGSMFYAFKNLQQLYLISNKIRRLSISPFMRLKLLETLDLSHNKVSHLKTSNFRGLNKLQSLCISNNNIESIDIFSEDLNNLKLLDLSYNKIQNILNEDLIHLKELTVLNLGNNYIKYISATAFRNLNKITQINLVHNKLQKLSLQLLSSIENHVQDVSLYENAITCSCDKNNTWTWIQDHPRIVKSNTMVCANEDYPKEKCDPPTISQLSVDKHKDNSVSLSWFIRNRTAIKALQLIYYSEDGKSELKTRYLEKNEVSTRIKNLGPNLNYVVCIITLYDDPVYEEYPLETNTSLNRSETAQNLVEALLMNSASSECTTFNTFQKSVSVKVYPNKEIKFAFFINRKMGLIIGCSLGVFVFFIMVSVLLYTKVKERKRIEKSDPNWSEMNDYHSVISKEDNLQSNAASTDNILLGISKNRKQSLKSLKKIQSVD